jgi:hypothetical protein
MIGLVVAAARMTLSGRNGCSASGSCPRQEMVGAMTRKPRVSSESNPAGNAVLSRSDAIDYSGHRHRLGSRLR